MKAFRCGLALEHFRRSVLPENFQRDMVDSTKGLSDLSPACAVSRRRTITLQVMQNRKDPIRIICRGRHQRLRKASHGGILKKTRHHRSCIFKGRLQSGDQNGCLKRIATKRKKPSPLPTAFAPNCAAHIFAIAASTALIGIASSTPARSADEMRENSLASLPRVMASTSFSLHHPLLKWTLHLLFEGGNFTCCRQSGIAQGLCRGRPAKGLPSTSRP